MPFDCGTQLDACLYQRTNACIHKPATGEMTYMHELAASVWDTDGIAGQGLTSQRFGDVVGSEPTLLIFLRHLG